MDKNITEIIKLLQEEMKLIREFFVNEFTLAGVTVRRAIESHE